MPLSEAETLKLIHELQVNQIELELQHEELLKARELELLHESEEKYRYMFSSNPQPMWIYDLITLAFLEVNDAAISHYGYSKEEFRAMTLKDIRPDEDVDLLIKDLEQTRKTYNQAGEWRHRKKNGEIIRVEISSHTITYGGRQARHVMVNDITARKLVEETLYQSEERSRNALDHLLEGCQIIGFDWRYIYLNNTAEIHNKRPKEELLGQRYMDMWPGIEETEVFKVIRQTLEERVSAHFENEFTFPDGSLGWFDLSIQPVPEGVFILSIDITERKKIENALRESEEKYRLIADNSDDWIYWVAPDGHLHYVSPACERVTGYSPDEFANHPELTHEIVFGADKTKVSQHTRISKLDDTPHNLEFRVVTKSGEIRWINHSCSPIFNADGEYLGRRGTNRNITERKLQEEQLFESEFRFGKLYENGPFGMVMADKEFRFKKANPAFCAIMGYNEAELLQFTFKDVSHPDDLSNDLANVRKLMNKEIAVYKTEKRYIRKDGQPIWGSLTLTATYDSEGQFLYNLGIIEDITHRKQAEEDLRERENKLSTILNLLPVGISILDQDQKIVYENSALENILGITREGIQTGDYRERKYLRSDGTPKPSKEFASIRAFKEKTEQYNIITGVVKEDGHTVWTNVSAVPVEFPDWKVVLVTADITGLKRTEDALKKSKQLLSETESMGKVGGWELYIDTMKQTWTDEVYRIHEVDFTFNPNVDKGISFYTPESKPMVEKAVQRAIQYGESFDLELEIITAKGNLRKVHTIGKADLENRRVYGFFQDITERKLAEEKIRELNERISTATRASQVGIWDWDIINDKLTWDDQMYALYGLKKDEFAGAYEAWVNGLHPDDKEHGARQTEMALIGEKEYDTEFRVVWPDGTIRHCKAKGEVFRNENGEPVRMVGINYDVTEQKKIDQKIREKDQEFKKLSANVPDLLFQFTRRPDGTYFVPIASEGIRNIFGCAPEDVIDDFTPIAGVIYPEDAERVIHDIEYSAEHMTYFSCEFRVQIPGRKIQWIYSKSTPERLPDGSITWYGFNTDITERKNAEETLKISEERYRNIFESSAIGIYRTTPEGKILMANPTLISLLGFESFEELAKRNLENEGYEQEGERSKFRESIEKQGRVIGLESAWKTKDGQSVIVNENARAFYDSNGQVIYYEGTIEDITRRKLAEKTLQESEEKFRLAFSTNPDAITITRLSDGKYISANSGFTQIFGYSEEEVIGKNSLEIKMWPNPDDRKPFVDELKTKGLVENFEARLCAKDGKIKDTLVSAILLEFDGETHVLSTTKNITEYKQAEAALRYNEALLREVGRLAKVGGWEYNTLTGQSSWTEQVARIHDHDLDPETPASVALSINFYTSQSRPIIEKAFRDVVDKAKPYDLELEIVTAKGIHKWVRTIGHPVVENGKVVQVHGSFQDVTERKLAEEALRESEENFRKLMESIPLPVTYVNSQSEIVFRNDRFIQVLGYTNEEVPTVKEWWPKAYPDETYREQVIRQWNSAVENAVKSNADIEPIEYQITCNDGHERTMIVSGIIIEDNLLITFIDITDRKKAEEEVRKLNETLEQRVEERTAQLKEANRELEAFSYSVSHDLRAPLRHINGFVDLLTENYTDLLPEKGKHYLEVIVNSSRHMGTLIDDLLQFSRTGRQEMQETDLNMNDVLQDVLNSLRPDIEKREMNWTIAVLPNIKGDQSLLRMAWYNLLSNAIKFTRDKNPAQIQIGFTEDEKEYTFFVRDNGAGFDMHFVHKLFGVFQRLHTTKEFEGTGIGLANVRRIILKHGGRIWAESQLNEGATFYFTLPKPKQ